MKPMILESMMGQPFDFEQITATEANEFEIGDEEIAILKQ